MSKQFSEHDKLSVATFSGVIADNEQWIEVWQTLKKKYPQVWGKDSAADRLMRQDMDAFIKVARENIVAFSRQIKVIDPDNDMDLVVMRINLSGYSDSGDNIDEE